MPRRLRADWRQEWEAELRWRELQLADWDKLDRKNKLALLWHSVGALADALWLQPKRWEDEMIQDLRYGVRMLLKYPGLSLVIGSTFLLRPLTLSRQTLLRFWWKRSVLCRRSWMPTVSRSRSRVTFPGWQD